MTHESDNRDLMLSVLRAFRDGELEPLFAAIADDVMWRSHAPSALFRFGGVHKGRAGVKEYTALLSSRYHFVRLEPRQVIAKGDVVWGLFEGEAVHQPSGRHVRSDLSFRWVMRNGLIAEHDGFFDTASVLIQQGDLQAA